VAGGERRKGSPKFMFRAQPGKGKNDLSGKHLTKKGKRFEPTTSPGKKGGKGKGGRGSRYVLYFEGSKLFPFVLESRKGYVVTLVKGKGGRKRKAHLDPCPPFAAKERCS